MKHDILIVLTALAGMPLLWLLVTQRHLLTKPVFAEAGVTLSGKSLTEHTTALHNALAANTKPQKVPSRRKVLITAAGVVILTASVIGGALLVSAPPSQPVMAYLFTAPRSEVVFLQVQGALTSTTGTWLEADVTPHGVVRHEYTFTYASSNTTVHLLLATPAGDEVVNGAIVGSTYSALDLQLPVNAVGIFPPLAHFVAATPADWNSAYTTLLTSVGLAP